MALLVIDSSVAIKWFVPEPYSTEARRILDAYQTGVISFLAPDLLNAEFGNIVWKKRLYQGLADDDAQIIIEEFRKLGFTFASTAILLEEAYRLAAMHHRTVYDAMYLALSVREICRFVTADEKLVNAVGPSFPNIVWLANWS